ncbi:sensor histidine kinase [Salimicrobium humidisoli]|nr:HAMP domain-containing sensor histidine kinase [Salimicrobium humidisoli]PBB06317.1 sensor histidine kinase [Salimicrobium humidisoli]
MRSLYTKFLLYTLIIMSASFLIGFLLANAYYQNNLKPETDRKNMQIAKQIASYAESSDNPEDYLSTTASTGYQLFLKGPEKSSFFGNPFDGKDLPEEDVQRVIDGETYHGMRDFSAGIFVTGFFANELRNSVGVPVTIEGEPHALFLRPDIKLLFNEVHILFGQMAVVIVILSLLAMLLFSGILVHPIRKLSRTTNVIKKGDFTVHPDIHRKDEIGTLARNFSSMIDRLGEVDRLRRNFVSNVSHDFQTPLLNIRGYSHLLESPELSEEEKTEYIKIIQDETERLSTLSRQLLLLSSIEDSGNLIERQSFDIKRQLEETLRRYHWRISSEGLALTYTFDEATYSGNAELLQAVWDNLITNAIKYSKPDSSIHVSLQNMDKEITVSVRDEGIGMSEAEMSRAFDRFYRADEARSRTTDGTGLGLSIVKEVTDIHGGTASVSSIPGEGTVFTITLPHL